ncbi:MAG: hypothetical protein EBE86_016265 [Hormoscilla sp. GUM202]|nr:hypothetical protein [Hormoscilla sp. GUM202]
MVEMLLHWESKYDGGACFNATEVKTNIGILQAPGYDEPWIVAMDCPASSYKTRDYGIRWGIEPMFSDFKTRGFGITETQKEHADRIECLILVMALAMYWSTSAGMSDETPLPKSQKKRFRSWCSLFIYHWTSSDYSIDSSWTTGPASMDSLEN